MGTNKFYVFDENRANLLSDAEYSSSDYRKGGAVSGIAPSNVHNKVYLQTSMMATAIAQVIADTGRDVSDASLDTLVSQLKDSMGGSTNRWRDTHAYAVGDICVPSIIGDSRMMECIVAGTSGSTEPSWGTVGQTTPDGAVKWIIGDIRDRNLVGDVVFRYALTPGYVKANGALLSRSTYSRLWNYANTNGLTVSEADWANNQQGLFSTGDTTTTFRIPDFRGEFIRALDEGRGVDASRTVGSAQGATGIGTRLESDSDGLMVAAISDDGISLGTQPIQAPIQYNIGPSTARRYLRTRPMNIALLAQIKY